MSAIPALLKAPARTLLKKVPTSLLEKIEDAVQKQLGKGSGAWSTKDEARLIADFAKALQINNVVAIDAGANVGNWSAELLKCLPNAKVFAFEPSQTAFDELEARFSNDKRVTCLKIALGKENATSFLYADKGGSGLGSLTKRRVHHFNIDFSHQEPVAIKTLDTWVKENSEHNFPNILKMDVEGHEYDLLLGATDTLKSIQIIQFEFGGSNIDTRTFFQDFWYFFKDLEFEIYRITPSKPILINFYSERDEIFRATNYIAVRKNVNATI